MSETPELSTCPICAAAVVDADKHAKWHKQLPGDIGRAMGNAMIG